MRVRFIPRNLMPVKLQGSVRTTERVGSQIGRKREKEREREERERVEKILCRKRKR